jgi:anti-anti-sigma factor
MEQNSGLASAAPVRQTLTSCAVDIEMSPNNVLVSVIGELDMADADEVGQLLTDAVEAGKPIVRLELSRLTFADSSAIKAVLVGHEAARNRGVTYEIVNPHTRVKRLLEVTGLTSALTVLYEPESQEGPNSL